VKHGPADASQNSRYGGVRDLCGDLSAPHVEVGPDHDRQLHRHWYTVVCRSVTEFMPQPQGPVWHGGIVRGREIWFRDPAV